MGSIARQWDRFVRLLLDVREGKGKGGDAFLNALLARMEDGMLA